MDDAPTAITVRREPGAFTRSLVALLLRVGLGLILLFAGMSKLDAKRAGKYPGMITDQYPTKIAFPGDVKLFANVLPYAEIGVGALLLGGLLTTLSAFLAGALLLVLLFGHIHKQHVTEYPAMLTYLLVNAAVLWLSPVTSNYFSLDGLLFGWFWKPRSQGDFRREAEAAMGRRH